MQILELVVFLLEVPFCPAGCDIDFVDEGVTLKMADFDLGHGDLCYWVITLIVE